MSRPLPALACRPLARVLALLLLGALLGVVPASTASAKPGDEKWRTRVFARVP